MTQVNSAIAEIVESHGSFVRTMAVRFAPAPGLADDIAQQVFLEFISKSDTWDLTRDVRPLFVGITRNVALRAWREYTRSLSPQSRDLAEHIRELAEGKQGASHAPEQFEALKRCIGKLPSKSQRLIELHYFMAISSVEIANQTAMTADAVRRALFRLREQLRRCVRIALKET